MVLCFHAWPAGQYTLKSLFPQIQIPLFQLFEVWLHGEEISDQSTQTMEVYGDGDRKIHSFLLEQEGDWIRWHKNPPLASHMSGVWERQIRSARAILGSILKTHGECLDEESLLTVMTEVEGILNSRSLTVELLNYPTGLQPLSLVNVLTMKSKVVSPPPGEFSKPDIYNRKRW